MAEKHSGRTEAEKAGRLIGNPAELRAKREARKREEEEWAEKAGPVTVRKADDDA